MYFINNERFGTGCLMKEFDSYSKVETIIGDIRFSN